MNNPADPGGETKFGISKRSYPFEDIANLTLDRASEIYHRDFWEFDAIADQEVATKLLDFSVNMGKSAAISIVQQALGLPVDGIFGPLTIAAINRQAPDVFLQELRARAALKYCKIVISDPSKGVFLLGWLRRAVQ